MKFSNRNNFASLMYILCCACVVFFGELALLIHGRTGSMNWVFLAIGIAGIAFAINELSN